MKQYHRGISDSQANALALARRESKYAAVSEASQRVAWDFHAREPKSLGDAAFMVRKAFRGEVPEKLHEGSESIGDDGTPRMDAQAVGYIFGSPYAVEREADDDSAIEFYRTPFRAALAHLDGHSPERAAIVRRVALGEAAIEATVAEGIPTWAARIVADQVLRGFLRILSDLKVKRSLGSEAVA